VPTLFASRGFLVDEAKTELSSGAMLGRIVGTLYVDDVRSPRGSPHASRVPGRHLRPPSLDTHPIYVSY